LRKPTTTPTKIALDLEMELENYQISQVLGHKDYDEAIHRDNLVITKQDRFKNKI